MMKGKINNDAVYKVAKPQDKDYTISDGGGLGLMVKTDGVKRWTFSYRFNKRQNKLGFGLYPNTTLEQARKQAEECRRQVKQGIDPAELRKLEKAKLKAEAEIKARSKKAVNELAAEITQQIVNSGLPVTNIIEFKVTVEVVRWQ